MFKQGFGPTPAEGWGKFCRTGTKSCPAWLQYAKMACIRSRTTIESDSFPKDWVGAVDAMRYIHPGRLTKGMTSYPDDLHAVGALESVKLGKRNRLYLKSDVTCVKQIYDSYRAYQDAINNAPVVSGSDTVSASPGKNDTATVLARLNDVEKTVRQIKEDSTNNIDEAVQKLKQLKSDIVSARQELDNVKEMVAALRSEYPFLFPKQASDSEDSFPQRKPAHEGDQEKFGGHSEPSNGKGFFSQNKIVPKEKVLAKEFFDTY